MKATVVFDSDVAMRLADLRRGRNISYRQIINAAMREWLSTAEFAAPSPLAKGAETRFETPVVRGGKWLLPEGVVCTQDILDWAEEGALKLQTNLKKLQAQRGAGKL